MENLTVVVVFALTLVALVALGRGVRGKFGGIEIATKKESISGSKKIHKRSHTESGNPPCIGEGEELSYERNCNSYD